MKPIESYYREDGSIAWPSDEKECQELGRALLLREAVSTTRYWTEYGQDFVLRPHAAKSYERNSSEIAKKDRAFREVFATLGDTQRQKVVELLEECVRGAVFSTLCTLDQFPSGEAEVHVWDGVCGEGTRKFQIAPTHLELHEEFTQLLHADKTQKA